MIYSFYEPPINIRQLEVMYIVLPEVSPALFKLDMLIFELQLKKPVPVKDILPVPISHGEVILQ